MVKFCQFVLKILRGNEVLVQIKGHNSDTNMRKRTCNNPTLDLVNKILRGNEVLVQIKGHNSGTNMRKRTCNNPTLDLVNMNAYIKFGENLSICSQDIERKRNSGENQGP